MSSSPKRPAPSDADIPVVARDSALDWRALEEVMHRDAGGRGLAGHCIAGVPLDVGQLRAAALELARCAQSVGIVTGFCSVLPNRVTAETDGPPGALFLVQVLRLLDVDVTLITDRYAMPLLQCGCDLLGLDRGMLIEFPLENGGTNAASCSTHSVQTSPFVDQFLSSDRGRGLTHLIAIERPGPSHTLASVKSQVRGDAAAERFLSEVSERDRDVCHNMHGTPIDAHTAKTHRLFEVAHTLNPPIKTIGIGDGGNEIGMGSFAWEALNQAVGGATAGRIACRIATDFTLIAGVSNWGAYALALAVAHLRGRQLSNHWLEPAGQRALIEKLVADAGAVDGRTLRAESTVDGLPLDACLQPLAEMLAILDRQE